MVNIRSKVQHAVRALLSDLSTEELRQAVDFIAFLKTRSRINPTQAYFWTTRWQLMERRIEQDKRRRRLLGDGTVGTLLRALKA